MYHPKYGLFYDFHTDAVCMDVGKDLDAEKFAQSVADCGADFLTIHARCNQGFSYYDTRIGIRHPGLKRDLFGAVFHACRKRGIAVSAYLNGGLSHEEGIEHPEWLRVSPAGRIYEEDKMTPFVRSMCFNSPYREHLKAMIREIGGKYHPDGFFIDCYGFSHNCVCPTCVREMRSLGYDPQNMDDLRKFGKFTSVRLAKEILEAARESVPEPMLYFNGLGYEEQKNTGTYIECECLPTSPTWGYDHLPLLGRHIRALGYPFAMNMTARFYDWGDFGSIRKTAGIQSDLFLGLALGLRPNIGSHMHPSGRWEDRVFRCVKEVYSGIIPYEPYFAGAKPVAEAAVVFTKDNLYFSAKPEMRGAAKLLSELQIQFDVITPSSDFEKYELLIFMKGCVFTEETCEKVRRHLKAGKAVFVCADAGLNSRKDAFSLEKESGVKYEGPCSSNPAYFLTTPDFSEELASMPRSFHSNGTAVSALEGTEVAGVLVKPYVNFVWDGLRMHYYNPPDSISEEPAVTFHGKCAYCTHDLFGGYYTSKAAELKELVAEILKRLLPNPVVRLKNAPSFARAIVSGQAGQNRILVYLHSYVMEDKIAFRGATLCLRTDRKITKVFLAGSETELTCRRVGDYLETDLPEVSGFAVAVFSFE